MMSSEHSGNDRRTALSEVLAELYPTVDESRRVVAAAGLAGLLPFIRFNDERLVNWCNILDETRKRGKVDALVGMARSEFPDHKMIAALDQDSTRS
jgi:hypothetical protein